MTPEEASIVMATSLEIVERSIEEGVPLTEGQRIRALAGSLRTTLGLLDAMLGVLPNIGSEEQRSAVGLDPDSLMLIRASHLLQTHVLDYCGASD